LYGLVASVRPKETKPLIRVDALRARAQPEERSMWILSPAHLAEEAQAPTLRLTAEERKFKMPCLVSLTGKDNDSWSLSWATKSQVEREQVYLAGVAAAHQKPKTPDGGFKHAGLPHAK
jgi:hypothetical protein